MRRILLIVLLCSAAHQMALAKNWIELDTDLPASAAPLSMTTNAPGKLRIQVVVNGFWKSEYTPPPGEAPASGPQTFDEITIPGWSRMQSVGLPAIPVRRLLIPVDGDQQPQVTVASSTTTAIDPVVIVPVQPPYMDVYPEPPQPAFTINEAFYQTDTMYPPNTIVTTRVVRIRNQAVLEVEFAGIRFKPDGTGAEALTSLELDIAYAPEEQPTENPAAATTNLPIFMILMDDQFTNNATLSTFIDWKKRKGCNVRTVLTSDINAGGAPTNSEIVAYMRNLSDDDYPDYLLIIGDQTAANGVEGFYFNTYAGGYTDLDIACRTNTDYLPDLFHGRMPAANNAQATLMLQKALFADRTPPSSGMFTNVIVAGQIQDSDDNNNVADRLFCETGDTIASYFEQHSSPRYACTRAVVNPSSMTATGKWNENSILWASTEQIGTRIFNHFVSVGTAQSRINSVINSGAALIFHRDHGYSNGAGWADPSYTYYNVSQLSNNDNRTVVFSINCASGAYHVNNNFTQTWIQHPNGGAYAVFAPVDISYSWLNDWLTHGFMTGFLSDYVSFQNSSTNPNWSNNLPNPGGAYGTAGSAQRLGEILNFGKLYMYENFYPDRTTFRLFHLFGDPESWIRVENPSSFSASHASEIELTSGAQNVSINAGVNGANVCLYSEPMGIHQVAQTSNGRATFSIAPRQTGTINVTITKYGYAPYEGTITATAAPFSCQAFALTNSVLLRWTPPMLCGVGCSTARVNFATTDYPAHSGAGTIAYAGTNATFEHTNLSHGQSYYYSIWVTEDGLTWTNPPQ